MGLELTDPKSDHEVLRSRLELLWVNWNGSWDDFVSYVKKERPKDESKALALCPDEFKVSAVARKHRVETWCHNQIFSLYQKMDGLTNAEKTVTIHDGNGDKQHETVPDNNIRLQATKFLIELLEDKIETQPERRAPGATESITIEYRGQAEVLGDRLSDKRTKTIDLEPEGEAPEADGS